jgi:hypothetical protein
LALAMERRADLQEAARQPRHILPKDLAVALKQLDDREIDALLSAVTMEAERRGRLSAQPRPKGKFVADARGQTRQRPVGDGAGSLTTGKLNAVRAAFKAGVKPSAIARQFGISQTTLGRRSPPRAGIGNPAGDESRTAHCAAPIGGNFAVAHRASETVRETAAWLGISDSNRRIRARAT